MRNRKIITTLAVLIMLAALPAHAALDSQITSPELRKAWESLNARKPRETVSMLNGCGAGRALDPSFLSQYHFLYAEALGAEGKPLAAVEHYRLAYLYSAKGELKELALLKRGEAYLKMNFFYEARTDFASLINDFPASAYLRRARLGLAESMAETGLLREAAGHYDAAGSVPEAIFGKARTLQRLGMADEAYAVYRSGLLIAPNFILSSEKDSYYLGENLRQTGRTDEAKKYLQTVKGSPFLHRAEISLGLIAAAESKAKEAEQYFTSALLSRERRTRSAALLNLADIRMKAGKAAEAKQQLEEIRLKYPYSAEYDKAILKLAGIQRLGGDYAASVKMLKELVFRRNPSKEALDQFEAVLRDAKEKKDAAALTDLWRSVGPWLLDSSREAFLLEICGALTTGKESFEIAQWLLRNGSEKAKDWSLISLAGFYAGMGEPALASEYLGKIKGRGSADEIRRLRARICYMEKDFRGAAENLLSLKRVEPGDLGLLGDTLTSAKDVKKAVAFFEKAVLQTGGSLASCSRLADTFFDSGKKAEALRYYRLALEREPANEWALYRLAALSEDEGAEKILTKVGAKEPALKGFASARLKELNIARKIAEDF